VDLATFLALHPEFADAPAPFVQAHLDAAATMTPCAVWGELRDTGQEYLAAHRMILAPFGSSMRLDPKSLIGDGLQLSPFGQERARLEGIVSVGVMVL
jgi:hypothetical protein